MFRFLNLFERQPASVSRKAVRGLRLEHLDDRCLPSSYFVATTGNDTNLGTLASPFGTVQHALDVAKKPGDIIQVRGGTYNEQIRFRASGSSKLGSITLSAYPGEHPVLDGTNKTGLNMVLMSNVSYVNFTGFEIANLTGVFNGSAIRVLGSGTNIQIRDNIIHEIRGTDAMGITVYGTSVTKPIANLILDNNEIYDAEPAPREALTVNGNVSGFRITGNRVHDVNSSGIGIVGGERGINLKYGARSGVVQGNTVYNVHANAGVNYAAGIIVDGGQSIVLEDNVTHDNDLGIKVGARRKGVVAEIVRVRNNLIYENDISGLVFGGIQSTAGRVEHSLFYNNTLYKNDTHDSGHGQLWIQYASTVVVSNNILFASDNNILIYTDHGSAANLRNNLYYAPAGDNAAHFAWNGRQYIGLASFQAGIKTGSGSLFGDPLFTNAAALDFSPRANSPTIDVGFATLGGYSAIDFTGRRRPQGGAPDIGAYEYVAQANVQGLDANQKRRAEQLTSIFENDTTELQYGYIEALGDGRGYTAGRAGFTTATSDLLDVVERYTARVPGNSLAPYLARLRVIDQFHSSATSGLAGFPTAWQNSSADPIFRQVQDDVVAETYYVPAVAHWNELGLHSALSLAAIYDAIIQHGDGDDPDGLSALISRTNSRVGGTPATGVNEHIWLDQFLIVRREDLANAYDPATRAAWAESVSRVDVFKDIVTTGNYNLTGPINVNSPVYGQFVIA